MEFNFKKLNIIDICFFVLIMLQYLNCNLWGDNVSGHFVSCIIITIVLLVGIFLNKIKIYSKELVVIASLILPFYILGIVQCLAYENAQMLVRVGGAIFNVTAAYCVGVIVGFIRFTQILRWLMLANIVIMITTVLFGDVIFDVSAQSAYSGGWFISWGIFRFPVVLGSWDIGIDTFRCGGLFFHPNCFGLMATVGVIGLSYIACPLREKIFWWVIYAISFIISESRASILFVMTFYIFRNIFSTTTIRALIVNVFFISLSIIIGYSLLTLRSGDVSNADYTSGRTELMDIVLYVYSSGLDIQKYIGIGIGNATQYLQVATGMNIPLDNSYIPLLLEQGILGLFVWLLILACFFCYGIYVSNWKFTLPYLIGMLVYSIFEHEFSLDVYSLHWLVYFFCLVSHANRSHILKECVIGKKNCNG